MDKSRIKNYILVVLALVNAIFLLMLLADGGQAAASRQEMEQNIQLMLSRRGVAVDAGAELIQEAPEGRTLYRDLDTELRLVQEVLGSSVREDMGGNIYFYSGQKGQAHFRGTGEFDILLNTGEYTVKKSPEAACEELMGRLGMDAAAEDASLDSAGGGTVTLNCRWDGAEVFNCRTVFTFSGDSLILVQGQRLFDSESEDAREGTVDSATALTRFAEELEAGRWACSRLISVTLGYTASVSVSGECAMSPVWRLETDTGYVYISAVTGRVQSM